MMKWLKQLFCKHQLQNFISNIYGDGINYLNARSIWRCEICGKIIYKKDLGKE